MLSANQAKINLLLQVHNLAGAAYIRVVETTTRIKSAELDTYPLFIIQENRQQSSRLHICLNAMMGQRDDPSPLPLSQNAP